MTRAMSRVVLAAAIVCLTAVVSLAQQTTTSTATKAFEVLAVDGNTLVVRLPEGTRELKVADDFRFTDQRTADVRARVEGGHERHRHHHDANDGHTGHRHRGEEWHRPVLSSGTSIIVRTPEGIKSFTQGDIDKRGVKIMRDGKPASVSDFRAGDVLTATIITSRPPQVMTQQQVNATLARRRCTWGRASGGCGTRAVATREPAGTGGPAAAAPAPRTLPKTASSWPLLALASIMSLVMGLTLTIARRFVQ